ncbi:MAG: CRISPR-associated protein Cas5 [Alicyclobacillus shizuokensis]|nr:CRISPR-associated protein Cas5 [Alicyclobacillus shizuokensis]
MTIPDGIVVFEMSGRMAHFRKVHTNSSSLTYLVPPRTTLSGIIAAILGLERDSYYEWLGPKNSRLTVSLRTPVRTVMQTMNNLFVKSTSDLSGFNGHTQVPTELVIPQAGEDVVTYRVYFSHTDSDVMSELGERIVGHKPVYPVSLGTAPMLASLHWVELVKRDCLEHIPAGTDIDVVTPCLLDDVAGWAAAFDGDTGQSIEAIKDLMPYSFGPYRTHGWSREFILERSGNPMPLRLRSPAWRLHFTDGQSEVIAFAEDGES